MRVRPLERGPDTWMTSSALLIDRLRLSSHQTFSLRLVHRVAARTGNATSGVTTLNASDVIGLISMAYEAGYVGADGSQLCGIDDVSGRHGLEVHACRAVATLARMIFAPALLIEIDCL